MSTSLQTNKIIAWHANNFISFYFVLYSFFINKSYNLGKLQRLNNFIIAVKHNLLYMSNTRLCIIIEIN